MGLTSTVLLPPPPGGWGWAGGTRWAGGDAGVVSACTSSCKPEPGHGGRREGRARLLRPSMWGSGVRGWRWQVQQAPELGPSCRTPGGDVLKKALWRLASEWDKPSFRGAFCAVSNRGICRTLYRPRCPLYIPRWRPVPARGWEFCRLYRNRHPIFLQLSDFVNLDYTDRRKVF